MNVDNDDDVDDVVVLVTVALLLVVVTAIDTFGVMIFVVATVPVDVVAVETGWIVQPILDAPIQ